MEKVKSIYLSAFVWLGLIGLTMGCSSSSTTSDATECTVTVGSGTYSYEIAGYTFCQDYPVYGWNSSFDGLDGVDTDDVSISIGSVSSYGDHYYVAVNVPTGNVSWIQAAYLADALGGYLAVPNTSEENDHLFSLVNAGVDTPCEVTFSGDSHTPSYSDATCKDDDTYFWHFDISTESEHNGVSIGPFLGGFQPDSAVSDVTDTTEASYGWVGLDGTTITEADGSTPTDGYVNWSTDLYCNSSWSESCSEDRTDSTHADYDYRDNSQPNASGDGQPFMGFGEMNKPVATWGDYTGTVGEYGTDQNGGSSYGFIVEFESSPTGDWVE